jgi:hypothetical protein
VAIQIPPPTFFSRDGTKSVGFLIVKTEQLVMFLLKRYKQIFYIKNGLYCNEKWGRMG